MHGFFIDRSFLERLDSTRLRFNANSPEQDPKLAVPQAAMEILWSLIWRQQVVIPSGYAFDSRIVNELVPLVLKARDEAFHSDNQQWNHNPFIIPRFQGKRLESYIGSSTINPDFASSLFPDVWDKISSTACQRKKPDGLTVKKLSKVVGADSIQRMMNLTQIVDYADKVEPLVSYPPPDELRLERLTTMFVDELKRLVTDGPPEPTSKDITSVWLSSIDEDSITRVIKPLASALDVICNDPSHVTKARSWLWQEESSPFKALAAEMSPGHIELLREAVSTLYNATLAANQVASGKGHQEPLITPHGNLSFVTETASRSDDEGDSDVLASDSMGWQVIQTVVSAVVERSLQAANQSRQVEHSEIAQLGTAQESAFLAFRSEINHSHYEQFSFDAATREYLENLFRSFFQIIREVTSTNTHVSRQVTIIRDATQNWDRTLSNTDAWNTYLGAMSEAIYPQTSTRFGTGLAHASVAVKVVGVAMEFIFPLGSLISTGVDELLTGKRSLGTSMDKDLRHAKLFSLGETLYRTR